MNALTFIIYVAISVMPHPISFGLPNCSGNTTGLTERYDSAIQTLYVDECRNGTITDPNLPVIDMTTSVAVIMTSKGRVTITLPILPAQLPFPTPSTTVQSSGAWDGQTQDNPEQEGNCDKTKLFLNDCVMGPRP